MPETSQEVYHCPSCGALAALESEESETRVCGECGFEFGHTVHLSPRPAGSNAGGQTGFVQRDIRSRRRVAERVQVVPMETVAVASEEQDEAVPESRPREEVVSDDGHKKVVRRRKKRRRSKIGPLLFLGGWAIVVMVIVILVRNRRSEEVAVVEDPQLVERAKLEAMRQQMDEFLSKEFPKCQRTLEAYLTAGTDARTQLVRNSASLAPTMRTHYSANQPWDLDESAQLDTKRTNVYMHEDRTTIEAVFETVGGEEPVPDREVAFVSQKNRWVIDWEALVRHSTAPWPLFLKEIGVSEGVFRVYLRNGKATWTERGPAFMVTFLPPHDNLKVMWEMETERIMVDPESENGKRLRWILKEAEREKTLGDSVFGMDDPAGLHRVRVELFWDGPPGNRSIKLRRILAANWYGSGFEEDFQSAEPEEEDAPDEEAETPEGEGEPDGEEPAEKGDEDGEKGTEGPAAWAEDRELPVALG